MLLARTSFNGFVVVFFANKMFHVFIDTDFNIIDIL